MFYILFFLIFGVANSCITQSHLSCSRSEDDAMLIRLRRNSEMSTKLVITSTGSTAWTYGGILGQYEYDNTLGYYVQSNTEKENGNFYPAFLYSVEDIWQVGPKENKYWLKNSDPSTRIPTSGWQYYRPETNVDIEDPLLMITFGPFINECEAYVVAASEHAADLFPSYLGVFSFTDRWWNGRPLLTNSNGRLMYHGNQDYGWLLSSDLDNNVIRGTMSHLSPEREKNWLYWDSSSSSYKQASLNVTCVIENK